MYEMKWIRTEDQLPEIDEHVLCCTENKAGKRNVVRGYYMDGLWRCGMNSTVTHWMPMPEPPGEGGHDTKTTGHWKIVTGEHHMRWRECSVCGAAHDLAYKWPFCPSCGADLRGGDTDT